MAVDIVKVSFDVSFDCPVYTLPLVLISLSAVRGDRLERNP